MTLEVSCAKGLLLEAKDYGYMSLSFVEVFHWFMWGYQVSAAFLGTFCDFVRFWVGCRYIYVHVHCACACTCAYEKVALPVTHRLTEWLTDWLTHWLTEWMTVCNRLNRPWLVPWLVPLWPLFLFIIILTEFSYLISFMKITQTAKKMFCLYSFFFMFCSSVYIWKEIEAIKSSLG